MLIRMIQKKLSKIIFFIGFAKVVKALICVSHATEILDQTDAKNPILAHNTQIPINSLDGTIDYITVPASTSITEIPHQISQARQSKGLSPHISLNQQDEFLAYPWYVNDDILVKSLMPGQITEIDSKKGQKVTRGQELCVMEAMKMKCVIRSPIDGEIIDILVKVDNRVGIQPILKLRPLTLESLNLQNIPNNQDILNALFPWEITITNVPPTEDLITVLSEEIEKQSEPSQPDFVPQTTNFKPPIVTNDQPLKSSLPLNSVEENLAPIISNNNSMPFKTLETSEQPTLLPLLFKLPPEMTLEFPEKMALAHPAAEEQITLSPLVFEPQITNTQSMIIKKIQIFKSLLPWIMAPEKIAPILPENNTVKSKNPDIYTQLALLLLIAKAQQMNVNFVFLEKGISSYSLDEKQIVLSMPVLVPQIISPESTIIINSQPFKTPLFIESIKRKNHVYQSLNITAKKHYSNVPIKFLSQKQDKIKLKVFMNVHQKLYLLLVLYCFALAFERFRVHFKRRAISLKTTHSKRFIPIFYKPAHNQNFSLTDYIKLA